MAVTFVGIASESFSILSSTSAPVTFWASNETDLRLHATPFFDCGNVVRMFLLIKVVPRRVLTAGLLTIWKVARTKAFSVLTCKSVFWMTSIESLKRSGDASFLRLVIGKPSAQARNILQLRLIRLPFTRNNQLGTVCGVVDRLIQI